MSERDLRDALADLADQAGGRDLAGTAWRTARRRRHRRHSAAGAAAVVVVAGLAFGFGVHHRGPAPAPAPPVASGPHSLAPSPRPASPSSPPDSPRVLTDRITFASPSGNITCAIMDMWVQCDVAERSWMLTPADRAWCGESALAGLALPAVGKPRFDCRTDVLVPTPQRVLNYGDSVTVGDVTCASATSGVTCTNSRTGHGFFVSRQSFEKH